MSKTQAIACVALLRGINVGKAKRIAMADLREILSDTLGFTEVRTLLNSGNALFKATPSQLSGAAAAIAAAIEQHCGFSVAVIVVSASELREVIAQNSLLQRQADPSQLLVAFLASEQTHAKAQALCQQDWGEEAFALGERAAYLHCASGVIDSKLAKAFARATGEAATSRNWHTVLKLQAMLEGQAD
ncbi:DUF1697 domain-containing protein [Roseateles sp. PN1]|uniref:DUF1697 domain-containing protein n=1 Tax=Roseateles sp. PN1 TaxID=3137372 RepID=UPI00313874B3